MKAFQRTAPNTITFDIRSPHIPNIRAGLAQMIRRQTTVTHPGEPERSAFALALRELRDALQDQKPEDFPTNGDQQNTQAGNDETATA